MSIRLRLYSCEDEAQSVSLLSEDVVCGRSYCSYCRSYDKVYQIIDVRRWRDYGDRSARVFRGSTGDDLDPHTFI